jgi:PD-(D/E)XK nuclease superfamily
LTYKGHRLKKTFEPDFVCFGNVIVEIKAVAGLIDEHRAQVLNYLNATGHEVALLVNFGHYPKLEYERIVHSQKRICVHPRDLRAIPLSLVTLQLRWVNHRF